MFRSTIPSFGAPLPSRTFDSECVNQQVTTTTQVHSADFESATGVSLCAGFQVLTRICWPQLWHAASGTTAQSKWDNWQTTWCTADVLVEREQESGTSNHWLAVNSKYCTNGAMFTFYPTDETHTVTMDVTFGTATSVNVLLFWRCPGGSGSWTSSSFMTNVSGTAGSTSPVSFTFNPATLSPSASGCEVMIMVRKNSCASTVETFYLDNVGISYQSTTTQPVLVKAGYRYGFNGQEKDNEVSGEGNSYGFEYRMYDTRLGRFRSLDSYTRLSTGVSLYSYAGNSPILFIDYQGKFKYPKGSTQEKDYPKLTNYLKSTIQEIAKNPTIVKALAEFGQLSEADIKKALIWGEGPTINVTELGEGINGSFSPGIGSDVLNINSEIVKMLENATGDDRDAALLLVASTILHEYTHYGDDQDGEDYTKGHGEEGQAFEEKVYGRDIDNLDDAKKTLNEYNERHGIEKRYSTGSSSSGTTLPDTPELDE